MTQAFRFAGFSRSRGALVALVAVLFGLLAGCGGGGGTDDGGGNADGTIAGSYSGRVEMAGGEYGLVTLTVRDESGTADGGVYVYDENQTRAPAAAASAPGRHFGDHPLLASAAVAGSVDPATRALTLSGTLIYEGGERRAVEMTGVLRGAGTDKGSLGLKVGPDAFTDGTFY